ncbi:hypothetical protein ABEB36_001642 [Hypothenemus hampei]|uniref:Uncharacterized protein n=1 Tax=Hypothenemus hampei TaxID=57062 RepID=A0ABD1FIF0_HYPHA
MDQFRKIFQTIEKPVYTRLVLTMSGIDIEYMEHVKSTYAICSTETTESLSGVITGDNSFNFKGIANITLEMARGMDHDEHESDSNMLELIQLGIQRMNDDSLSSMRSSDELRSNREQM